MSSKALKAWCRFPYVVFQVIANILEGGGGQIMPPAGRGLSFMQFITYKLMTRRRQEYAME